MVVAALAFTGQYAHAGNTFAARVVCSRGECLQAGEWMKSSIVKRSISVAGHKTNISLEDAFWTGLREIARSRTMTVSAVVADIDMRRQHANLSSAVRLFVLEHARSQAAARAKCALEMTGQC